MSALGTRHKEPMNLGLGSANIALVFRIHITSDFSSSNEITVTACLSIFRPERAYFQHCREQEARSQRHGAMDLPPTPPLSTTSESHDKVSSSTQAKPLPPNSIMGSLRTSIPAALSLPKEYVNKYNTFVTHNASSVSSLESALRSLTYIIPGRFRDAEIASESLHSGIQLLSLYHDSLLVRAVGKLPGMPSGATAGSGDSKLQRYTKYWTSKSKMYRRIALLLQCTRYTELLWEMAAKRRGEKIRWRVVVVIEIIKAICRLLLLRVTGGRMVVPPLPERDPIPEDPETSVLEDDEDFPMPEEEIDSAYASGSDAPGRRKERDLEWRMPRTGLTLPSLPNPSNISAYLLSKVLTADDIKPATNLLHKIQGSAQLAEVLHIVRPVIYALAMARAKDKKSWQPWLLGVSIELAARQMRADRINGGGYGGGVRETALEKEEWNRRGWAMGWWGLKGAFYENVSKGMVEGVTNSRFVPSIVGGIVSDYSWLWDQYHFASSDS
jgi:peroxin-16